MAAAVLVASLDGSALDLLVSRLQSVAGLLRELADATARASPLGWTGEGRRAYEAAAARVSAMLQSRAVTFETAGHALDALSVTLRSVQAELVQAQRIVSAGAPAALASIDSQLTPALQAFGDADRRAAALLVDVLIGGPIGRGRSVLSLSPSARASGLLLDATRARALPLDPVAVSLWWAGLSPGARAAMDVASPAGQRLAARDGMPLTFRNTANRRLLASTLRSAERDYTSAKSVVVHGLEGALEVFARELPRPLARLAAKLDPLLDHAKRRLEALQALTADLKRPDSELLEFDAAGNGRAVVASGDIGRSTSVAILVPGMSSSLEKMPTLVGESDAIARVAGAGSVVITWLGYDAPGVLAVASDARAKVGASELISFVRGLRATAPARQRMTVIGHSYGTLVAGLAAARAPIADDLVLLASPGVEASSAAKLEVAPGHVWAVRAPTDPIQAVFWAADVSHFLGLPAPLVFGPDPASSTFGAAHFGVGGAYGHSGYFSPGSQSLTNLGRIVSGRTG